MKPPSLSIFLLLLLFSCRQTTSKEKTAKVNIDTTKAVHTASLGKPLLDKAVSEDQKSANDLPDISGYYKEVDEQTDGPDEGCDISVSIKKHQLGYTYQLTTNEKRHSGKVTLIKDADKYIGIVFEGIRYAEYEGDISNAEDGDNKPELKLPVGVDAELSGDTINIQNYGNAMNYYVKFGGCQLKYIQLIKLRNR